MPLVGFVAWAIPGAGHLLIGEKGRGIIFLIVITLVFWAGIAIGGVKSTVNPQERSLWFLGQACAGIHPLAALVWGRQIEIPANADMTRWIPFGHTEDTAVVYTAIAGMLNILIFFDALTRLERLAAGDSHIEPPRANRRASS